MQVLEVSAVEKEACLQTEESVYLQSMTAALLSLMSVPKPAGGSPQLYWPPGKVENPQYFLDQRLASVFLKDPQWLFPHVSLEARKPRWHRGVSLGGCGLSKPQARQRT